jgi:1,2-diacylglycerol-3-alpha-glucose alpha-1,2-galactosyltransferase
MRVNIFSESSYTVAGHGVHSVYEDNLQALRGASGLKVMSSIFKRADVVHLHTVGPMSLILMRYAAPRRVVTAHLTPGSLAGSLIGGRLFASQIEKYLRWFYNQADVVIALSEHQGEELKLMGVTSAISVVPNGAPCPTARTPTRLEAKNLLSVPQDKQVVLSVGQLQPRKGVSVFYETASGMPDTLFVWVGGFPFGLLTSHYLKMRRMLRNPPNNVRHTGQLRRDEVLAYYAASDAYFHPSHHELGPMAVLEAATHGLPLVLRDLACYRQAFRDGYSAGTDRTFEQQIREILGSRALRDRMSGTALNLAREYSADRTARALIDVYKQLMLSI